MGRPSFPPAEPFTELALNRQVSEPISAPSRLTAFLPGALASKSRQGQPPSAAPAPGRTPPKQEESRGSSAVEAGG